MTTEFAELMVLNQKFRAHLTKVRALPLSEWMKLANELGVATNDREHAAKKLAIRELHRS